MDNKWTKRLVSLTVALEMFCSPVAMARAQEAATERPEIPAVVSGPYAETPAVRGGGSSGGSSVDSAADLLALPVDEWNLGVDLSFGIPQEAGVGGAAYPARYGGYFTHEGGSNRTWGYRTYNTGEKYFIKSGNNFYTVLPDPGRLPDLELDGFYVLGEPTDDSWLDEATRVSKVQSWTYDESWGAAAVRLKESNDDVTFTQDDDVDYFEGRYLTLAYLTAGEMDQLFAGNIARHDGVMGFVPVVARWQSSSNSNLTSFSAATYTQQTGEENAVTELFTEDPAGLASPDSVDLSAVDASYFADPGNPREFWLRVPEDQASLTLQFAAYEPYYAYNVTQNGEGDSPVSVSVLFNDRPVTVDDQPIQVRRGWHWDETGAPTDAVVPKPTDTGGWLTPRNTSGNPARSLWTVADIPLTKVDQAEDMDNAGTTITITVEAPDKQERSKYILHVERLMTPIYTLGLGNTPPAMIEKDERGNWGETESRRRAKKDEAKELFAQSFRLGYGGAVSPGDYTYYKSDFTTAAWTGFTWQGKKNYNIDLDETAVVAYQDTAFADPGVSFVGSNGKVVEFGANAPEEYQGCVTRTIALRRADVLTADSYGAAGEACWYTAEGGQGVLKNTETAQVLQKSDGSDGVDLRGLRVLPGIYTMTYTFTDPLDPGNPVVAQRPLVVLPIPGDVDMDGAVTVADAMALKARQADWETSTAQDVQLLRFRVLGTKSAQDIIGGFQPVLADLGRSDYFYPPLPTPDDASDTYERRTWDQVTMNGSARLELRFLGVEQGVLMGENGHTYPATDGVLDAEHGRIGPWQADADGEVTIREKDVLTGKDQYGIAGQNDVFWVGVYLTAGELAGSTVEDLTLTLTYDSDFVEPVVVYQDGQFPDASQANYWYRALYYYNFGEGSKLDQRDTMTLFSGYNRTDYDYETGSAMSRPYATHYSKVIGELEQLQSAGSLREMVVSIQGNDAPTSHRATLPSGEICVLAVPFRLLKHPTGGRLTDGQARLVELGAGMRDFTLVTKAVAGASRGVSASSVFGRLFSAYAGGDSRAVEGGDVTYAFSAQDAIYGGSTQNLREKVRYQDAAGAIPGLIPIGENKTNATVLRPAKYAEDYGRELLPAGEITGDLPAGMTYHNQAGVQGVLSGAPTEVGDGEFKFTITRNGVENYYVLPVAKRTLHFSPNGCGAYYGQSEYRGKSYPGFTFTYSVEDLADRDKPAGVTLEGDGLTELPGILGADGVYTPPTFTAKRSRNTTDAENPVSESTNVGVYPIILDDGTALDDKYDLVLDETSLSKQVLNIDARPVWIDHIVASSAQTGAQIYSDGSRLECLVTIQEKQGEEPILQLDFRDEVKTTGVWAGRPLSGPARVGDDVLKLTFSGEYQRNADDEREFPDNKDMFYMTAEEMDRFIGKISISEANKNLFNRENPNYSLQLVAGTVLNGEQNQVQGKVVRREITELEFSDYPHAITEKGSVTYGEHISLADLRIRVFRDDQQIGSQPYDFTYDYDGSMAQAMDIHYNWVTKEDMEKGLKSPNTVIGSGWDPTQPKGQQDERPYRDTNDTLSVDLDGYYLCAIARRYAENDPSASQDANAYVKVYSANPIHVLPKEVTLTVTDMNRFYGEETAQPRYTYTVNQLASADLQRLRAHYGQDYAFTGAAEELEWLLEEDQRFQKPDIQFMRSPRLPVSAQDEDLVTVDTNATNTYYYQVISGARSTNYIFRYTRVDGDRRPSADFGTAYLSIMKRPIVVADVGSLYTTNASGQVVSATSPGGKDTFAVLYADSKRLLLDDQVDNGQRTPFLASAAENAVNRVTFIAPDYDAETQTVTYYNGGASDNVARRTGMAYDLEHPVLEKDLNDLKVSYKVQFLPDAAHYSWNSFSDNYYSVEDLTAEGGQAQRPVELRELELTSENGTANNYMLVYKDSFQAVRQAPANSELTNAPNPTGTTDVGNAAFLQYGTGLVILRPIKTMDIKTVGCMQYIYGEYFAPDNPGVNGSQLTLAVNYDTRYDNYTVPYVGNVSSETVAYAYEADNSSFEKRGFVIHYLDVATQDEHDLAETDQVIMGGDALYPAVHNGKHLFVSGKRGEHDPLVYSSVTAAALEIAQTPLVLTARSIHRFYGESNKDGYVIPLSGESQEAASDGSLTFTYTFRASQLARWDREMLSQLLGETIHETDTVTQSQLEQALDLAATGSDEEKAWVESFGYQKPVITTVATETSPINTSDGKWGEYSITNTAKPFANYSVTGVGATLFVYPRPIRVTGIASSQADPVYTIYNQTAGKIFNTAFEQKRITVERSNGDLTPTWTQDLADGIHRGVDLPLTGAALVGQDGDSLKYRAVIDYNSANTTLPDGKNEAYMQVVATITDFAASADQIERNYVLSTSRNGAYTDDRAVGAVKLRTIGYIIIRQLPESQYDYGQTLSLDGLRVTVNYKMLGDEGGEYDSVNVDYIDANQFQSYGLYVNYWDPTYDVVPDISAWKRIPNGYRKAGTGDHLTIAPTHDTQQFLGNDKSKPLERPFAANGMGLIISAFQEGENQTPAQPKVLAATREDIPGTGVSSYEITATNKTPFTITVRPRQLQYALSATDKTYNGDGRTAGTLRLTNLFDQRNVQAMITSTSTAALHTPVYQDVTDVVYVPVGAAYETLGNNYQSYTGSDYRVTGSAISFTTGAYTDSRDSLLAQNPAVQWAGGYQWGQGLLEFTFPNPNVHYVDDIFVSGAAPGVGTAELAQYWRASQDMNGVDSRWDSYPEISQMPVEVSNMTFMGPDAANYTWGPSTEPQQTATQRTLDTDPASLGAGQGSLPYATVHKANRQSIQDLLGAKGFVLPALQVDDHTNVIRMTYGEDLGKIDDLTGVAAAEHVLSPDGKDEFRDELHFEYALIYEADGLLRQWAGREGDGGYQDTVFFGGETVAPEVDPGYVPELDRLDKAENADENTIYKGQPYRWVQEDTGLSQRGWRENSGFAVNVEAYPGYATYGDAIRDAYWYYDLYATDRAALPRDTVFYPLVRLAETHNYNPSGDLTADGDGDGRPDVSAWELYEARQAVSAYLGNGDETQAQDLLAGAQAKSGAVLEGCGSMEARARKQAQDRVAADAARVEDGFPEEPPQPDGPIAAVKSYRQRFDLLSASWERQDQGEYLVKRLEDVRFTDTLVYNDQKLMDSVVYNDPTRYYGYYWDPDLSASIKFFDEETPIDFDTVMEAEIRQRQSTGETVETIFTYDPEASNHTAEIYVNLKKGGGRLVRSIRIVPSVLFVRVGDEPVRLGVVTEPAMPSNRRYTWASSDPSVATVDENGRVTIRGEGVAVITVTTTNGCRDSIAVVVSPVLPFAPGDTPIFNFNYTGPWAELDGDYAFRPYETMTRSDVVELLDLFLNPEYDLSGTREMAYVDVTGREKYYGALARLTKVGAVVGVPGTAFAGERLASRAEFVTILARMLELNVPDTMGMAHAFADSGEDETWAYAYIDAMAKAGVVQGTGGGNFAPSRPITREEAAAILARLVVSRMDAADPDKLRVPSDMTPENWSYPAVLRAVNSVVAPGF